MTGNHKPSNLVTRCAYAGMIAAAPTALWRLGLAAGLTLGTPDAWRQSQDIPGSGTWYVLALSILQLAAVGCMLALTVDPKRLSPRGIPARLARLVPAAVGGGGLAGAIVLALMVPMSIIAWDKVDPFAGTEYGAWGWLCAACYLMAALWPLLLGAASIGYLIRHRMVVRGTGKVSHV